MIGIFDRERPRSACAPGVTRKNTANERHALGPFSEIVGGGMETDDALTLMDEIQDRSSLRFVGFQVGGAVKEDRVVLGEILLCEDGILIG